MLHLTRVVCTFLTALALLFSSASVIAQGGDGGSTTYGPPPPVFPNNTQPIPDATPAGVNVQAAGGGYLYALRELGGSANQIYGFQVNELTGALTTLPGFPLDTGGNGSSLTYSEHLAYDAANGRLYVINLGSNTVSAYSVNLLTGALSAMPFSPISLGSSGGTWTCLAVHPSGSPLIVGNSSSSLASFTITTSSATAATGSPYTTGTAPSFSCAFSRDGAYVYAGGEVGTTIAGFSVNTGTGVLSALPGSPFNSGANNPLAYATDAAGRLFAANLSANQVRIFTTNSGVPSPVLGNPFASGLTEAVQGVLHPSGYYMVADRTGNRVGVYRLSGSSSSTTLAAVSGSPFAAGGSSTNVLALNQSGAYLFAANSATRNITTFLVNASSGALLNLSTQITNTLGASGLITGLAYAGQPQPPSLPGSGFVYTLKDAAAGNEIYGYSVNEATGALTALPGFPVATGGNGESLTVSERMTYDAANARLYVVNGSSNTLSAYSVNLTTGSLSAMPFSPLSLGSSTTWSCVEVHPSGSPVMVSNDSGFVSFNITGSSATPASGSPFSANTDPRSCTISQDGAYLIGGESSGAGTAIFSINAGTGVLTAISGSPFATGAFVKAAYATDGFGRLFLADFAGNQVLAFTISGGVPSPVFGNPFVSGLTRAIHGIVHPSGYYMVADRFDNRVGVYRINGNGPSTTLAAVSGSPFGSGGFSTYALALNRSSTFLFAANGTSRNITTYSVDAATGGLIGVNLQPLDTSGSTGRLTGMTYVPGLYIVNLPLIRK